MDIEFLIGIILRHSPDSESEEDKSSVPCTSLLRCAVAWHGHRVTALNLAKPRIFVETACRLSTDIRIDSWLSACNCSLFKAAPS